MIDIPTILSIISIVVTAVVGSHYAIRSKCFGFEFSLHDTEIEMKNEALNIDIELKENTEGKIELDINKTDILEIPISK